MKSGLTLVAAIAGCALASSAAHAEDAPGSAIHGFGIVNLQNDYITPRGLWVTNNGATIQFINGLVFGLFHDQASTIDDVALVIGTFNDVDTAQHASAVGAWNEFDWFAGPSFHFAKNWNLDVQLGQFLSPPGNFKTETNLEFALSFNDAGLGLPLQLKPYVKWFNALSGDSTVVTGRRGGTFDVEIGMAPTLNFAPFTVTAPTWITVGPSDFWGGTQNVGVFSTGLTILYPLPIPVALGHWSAKAGFQFYDFINDRLRLAQTLLGTGPKPNGDQTTVNGFVGLTFGF